MKNEYVICGAETSLKILHKGVQIVTFIDTADIYLVKKYTWHISTRKGHENRCVRGYSEGKIVYLHAYLTGYEVTDHKNRDRTDNRRCNLRKSHKSLNVNSVKRSSGGTSRYKGVSAWGSTLWRARIRIKLIGYFKSEDQAARAYNREAIKEFGEFAWLNPVGDDKT
jgi:hypothetical protein